MDVSMRSAAIAMVSLERDTQIAKFGGQEDHDGFVWLAVLTEEVGEFAECVLQERFGGPASEDTLKEAVQTAAVALAIVECLIRNHSSFPRGDRNERL